MSGWGAALDEVIREGLSEEVTQQLRVEDQREPGVQRAEEGAFQAFPSKKQKRQVGLDHEALHRGVRNLHSSPSTWEARSGPVRQ